MKLDRNALFEVAHRLKQSRKVLERTHQRIGDSLDGLQTLSEIVDKATRILNNARNISSRTSSGKQQF
jgi:hypothetical protein